MAAIQVLPEVGGYTPLFKKGTKESAWQSHVIHAYGREIALLLQYRAEDTFDYNGRCKRAAILWQWINGIPIDEIERTFSVTPYAGSIGAGDIRRFADSTRLYLRAAYEIAHILIVANDFDEMAIDHLLKRLEVGLPEAALPLLSLPLRLTRGEYLALLAAGCTTPEAVRALSMNELSQLLSPQRAVQLMQQFHAVGH
ncbi:MAG: ski2-like helicase [bacterium ADurb.Bin429]|nr:MAG: ski2-like helicase [bacterium ADurb.Bin429]